MRYLLLSYLTVFLLSIALFILLSFNTTFGYVFIQWHGWQLQTNLLVLLIALFISSGFVYIFWQLFKNVSRGYLQKYQVPKNFNALHPYERLGILWLLHAERTEQEHINQTYKRSYLLYPLIRARLALAQNNITEAQQWLKSKDIPLFELVELLKIDMALLEKNADLALNRLEFLTVQPLSSWLIPIQNTYKIELQNKWLKFATDYPWVVFRSLHHPVFTHEQQKLWLNALVQQIQHATDEDWALFEAWYAKNKQLIQFYDTDSKTDILKVMSHRSYFDIDIIPFAEAILSKRFIPNVLYIWLGKQLKQEAPNLIEMEEKIQEWLSLYPAQPSLGFAQWHLYTRLNQTDKLETLLELYPDDPYMAYLRLQAQAKSSESILNDLKLMMQYSKQDFSLDL